MLWRYLESISPSTLFGKFPGEVFFYLYINSRNSSLLTTKMASTHTSQQLGCGTTGGAWRPAAARRPPGNHDCRRRSSTSWRPPQAAKGAAWPFPRKISRSAPAGPVSRSGYPNARVLACFRPRGPTPGRHWSPTVNRHPTGAPFGESV